MTITTKWQTVATIGLEIVSETASFRWAVANQGFDGDFAAWQALSADERAEYEDGAAGIPTA